MAHMRGIVLSHGWAGVLVAWTLYRLAAAASTACQSYNVELQACRCDSSSSSLEIDCSTSGLQSIPTDIPLDTSNLNLSRNRITAVENGIFERLKNLTKLDLSYNAITKLQTDSLLGLVVLQYLNLDGNSIPYASGYAEGSLNSLHRLETLHLLTDPCPNLYPDHIITGLARLRELAIYIPEEGHFGVTMSNLTNLDSLYVMSNCSGRRKLTVEDLESLYATPLRRLSLRNARLNHVDPNALQGFKKTLKKLDLSCNHIDNIPQVIAGLAGVRLETLLAENTVSNYAPMRLTRETLAALQAMNLTILSLANNLLLSLEMTGPAQSKLEPLNIKYFRIGYNQGIFLDISSIIDILPSLVPFLFNLRVLDASGFLNYYDYPITNCLAQDDLFTDDEKEWERDPIVYPAPKMPFWLWFLLVIYRYQHYSILTMPPFLTRLYLKDIGQHFAPLHCSDPDNDRIFRNNNVRIIDASGIHLAEIDCEIAGFELLEIMDVSRMHLEKYNPSFFSNSTMPRLAWLDLSNNNLGTFFDDSTSKPFDYMFQVKYLDVSYNGIKQLNEDAFDYCHSLTTLNVSGNSIENWHVSVSGLKNLETIDLSGNPVNPIEKVYLDQFDELHDHWKLKKIYLSNVTCNCNLEFVMWLHTTKVLLPDFACATSGVFSTDVPSIALLLWTCVGIYAVSALCSLLILVIFGISFKWRLRYAFYKLRHYFTHNNEFWHVRDITVYLAYHESESHRASLVQQFLSDQMDIKAVISRNSFRIGQSEYDQMALYIDRCHFVVLLASPLTTSDPKSEFELYMSLEKGASKILPVLVADLKSYDELPRVLKKLLLLNNHLLWKPSSSAANADRLEENEEFFNYLRVCILNLVSRQLLTSDSHPGISIFRCIRA